MALHTEGGIFQNILNCVTRCVPEYLVNENVQTLITHIQA